MKRIILTVLIIILFLNSYAQVTYFTGEWTKINNEANFSGILRLEIKDTVVTADILWIYRAIDSSDLQSLEYYRNKKGKMGIEYATGVYSPSNRDIVIQGQVKSDPDLIIGLDKYLLKFSSDEQVIYGKTYSNGDKDGLVYFIKSTDHATPVEFAKQEIRLRTLSQQKALK